MKTTRIAVVLSVSLVVMLLGAAAAPAASPPVGKADTSVSIFSVDLAGRDIDIGTGSGYADTLDPNSLAAALAFLAARAPNPDDPETDIEHGVVRAKVEGCDSACEEEQGPSEALPVTEPALFDGSVLFESAKAELKPSELWAHSTLGSVTGDISLADALGTLASLNGMKVSVDNVSGKPQADALQGVEIHEINILPLKAFLDRVASLSIDDLLKLAAALGGSVTDEEEAAAEAAKAAEEAAREAMIDFFDDFNPILESLGLDPVDENTDSETLLENAAAVITACEEGALSGPICDVEELADALSDAVDALNLARDTLEDALGELPLLSIKDLVAGVSAQATDTSSEATAGLTWGEIQVGGVTDTVVGLNLEEMALQLSEAVQDATDTLKSLPGFGSLGIDIKVVPVSPHTSEPNSKDGDFYVASSSVSALEVDVSLPASANGLDMNLRVLSLASDARHRPAILDDNPDLADTGVEQWLALSGIFAIAVAFRLRRWLGDAA